MYLGERGLSLVCIGVALVSGLVNVNGSQHAVAYVPRICKVFLFVGTGTFHVEGGT